MVAADRGGHQRPLLEKAGVEDRVAGGEIVGAVEHEIVAQPVEQPGTSEAKSPRAFREELSAPSLRRAES